MESATSSKETKFVYNKNEKQHRGGDVAVSASRCWLLYSCFIQIMIRKDFDGDQINKMMNYRLIGNLPVSFKETFHITIHLYNSGDP